MRRAALILLLTVSAQPLLAREAVDASAPEKVAVSVYRDPNRGTDEDMNRDWPRGFAMISETRTVTLPPGESTVRFEGVLEGMVAVTAIVTGLPGGTIEKNRNADLLSPGALVDGTLGNRVTITRTNPATGREVSESAIVRTRADGGLVLQTDTGYEAVRCSGLPEKLVFDGIPAGLSAQPVYSIDTNSPRGGTYTITLTYLSWGFDWQAHYVATLDEGRAPDDLRMQLTSWLTLVNDNGQSFPDAELLAIAGKLNVTSDYRALSDPPDGKPLQLTCYPFGSTAEGTYVDDYASDGIPAPYPPPPPPPPVVAMAAKRSESIVVTGSRMSKAAVIATEEDLADLKLYRVPEPVTVAAQSQKQIAFLQKEGVEGQLLHTTYCAPWSYEDGAQPVNMMVATVNDARHGLGVALPTGKITVYETSGEGEFLVGERRLRDYASGQDVEIEMGRSAQVFATCSIDRPGGRTGSSTVPMKLVVTNANPGPVKMRLTLGGSEAKISGLRGVRIKDGARIYELSVPGNSSRTLRWTIVDE